MVFVATQADASALNLGKISIKNIGDVSKETYDVIKSYGNKELTDDQIIALDDFLVSFNKSTWKSKVKRLVMPCLGIDVENPEVSTAGIEYANLYDIITKEKGKLLSGAGKNGDNNGAVVTFNKGIYVNSFANSANYVPKFRYSPLTINPKDTMVGVYGVRGNLHENNGDAHAILYAEPGYRSFVNLTSSQAGSSTSATFIDTKSVNNNEPFDTLFCYNFNSKFAKAIKTGTQYSSSEIKESNIANTEDIGFYFGDGNKNDHSVGDRIKLMTSGSSLTDTEMIEYDKIIREFLSVMP